MIKVVFNDVDEFLQDMKVEYDAGNIKREILRCTIRHRRVLGEVSLFVLAGFIVGQQIVELEHYVGCCPVVFDREPAEWKLLQEKAQEVRSRISKEAQHLGLDVRNGAFSFGVTIDE